MRIETMQKTERTITDFGEQWTYFTENEGYYGSINDLRDVIGPLMTIESLKGKKVAEIGSGTGRIVNILLNSEVTAIEPSEAFNVLKENTSAHSEKICYLNVTGDNIPSDW